MPESKSAACWPAILRQAALGLFTTYLMNQDNKKYSNNSTNSAVQKWMATVQSEFFTDREHYHLITNTVKITFTTQMVQVVRTGLRIPFSYLKAPIFKIHL